YLFRVACLQCFGLDYNRGQRQRRNSRRRHDPQQRVDSRCIRFQPPPTVTAAVAAASLWPPDSTLINVGLSATTSDGACPAPAVSSVQVWSDEDDETRTSGSEVFSPDAKNFGLGTLRLRAERVDSLDGRVYLIVLRAT